MAGGSPPMPDACSGRSIRRLLYGNGLLYVACWQGLIGVFVGALSSMKNLSEEEYDTLITKTTQ